MNSKYCVQLYGFTSVFIRKPYVHLGDTIIILVDEYIVFVLLHKSIIIY